MISISLAKLGVVLAINQGVSGTSATFLNPFSKPALSLLFQKF